MTKIDTDDKGILESEEFKSKRYIVTKQVIVPDVKGTRCLWSVEVVFEKRL